MLCWSQDWRKDWSLWNSSGGHSSASGERAQKMKEPQLLTKTHCHLWPEVRLDWKQARIHQPLYLTWSSISAPWSHFTLLGLLACSFHYPSPLYSEGCSKLPKWSSPPWAFRTAQTFVLLSNATYSMSQQHCASVGDKHMEAKPTATCKSVRLLKAPHWR